MAESITIDPSKSPLSPHTTTVSDLVSSNSPHHDGGIESPDVGFAASDSNHVDHADPSQPVNCEAEMSSNNSSNETLNPSDAKWSKRRRKPSASDMQTKPQPPAKDLLLTPEQAVNQQKKLQKGYALVPVTSAALSSASDVIVTGKRTRKKPADKDAVGEQPEEASKPKGKGKTPKGKRKAPSGPAAALSTPAPVSKKSKPPATPAPSFVAPSTPAPAASTDTTKVFMLQTKLLLLQQRLSELAKPAAPSTPQAAYSDAFNTPLPPSGTQSEKKKRSSGAARTPAAPKSTGKRKAAKTPGTGSKKKKATAASPASVPLTPAASATPALPRTTSRSNRTIKQPKALAMDDDTSGLKASDPLNKCRTLLKKSMGHKFAGPFLQPVDWMALGIPHYPTVVNNPMDLGTILSKLNSGQYQTMEEFKTDVDLVWSNATKFNPPGHDVYVMAETLKKDFDAGYEKLLTTINTPKVKKTPAPKSAKKGKAKTSPVAGVSSEAPKSSKKTKAPPKPKLDDYDDYEPSSYSTPAPALRRQVSSAADEIPLSFTDKQQLKADIARLPADRLSHVMDIIQELNPEAFQAEGEDVELDIDLLTPLCARRLQRYVKSVNSKKSVGKSRKAQLAHELPTAMEIQPTDHQSAMDVAPESHATEPQAAESAPLGDNENIFDSDNESDGGGASFARPGTGFAASAGGFE